MVKEQIADRQLVERVAQSRWLALAAELADALRWLLQAGEQFDPDSPLLQIRPEMRELAGLLAKARAQAAPIRSMSVAEACRWIAEARRIMDLQTLLQAAFAAEDERRRDREAAWSGRRGRAVEDCKGVTGEGEALARVRGSAGRASISRLIH